MEEHYDDYHIVLTDDIDEVLEGWITSAVYWQRIANEEGVEIDAFGDLLRDIDYLIQKHLPCVIDRVKFIKEHECEYNDDNICIYCGEKI